MNHFLHQHWKQQQTDINFETGILFDKQTDKHEEILVDGYRRNRSLNEIVKSAQRTKYIKKVMLNEIAGIQT